MTGSQSLQQSWEKLHEVITNIHTKQTSSCKHFYLERLLSISTIKRDPHSLWVFQEDVVVTSITSEYTISNYYSCQYFMAWFLNSWSWLCNVYSMCIVSKHPECQYVWLNFWNATFLGIVCPKLIHYLLSSTQTFRFIGCSTTKTYCYI